MFKDGDKIKCIDKGENKYITENKVYTVIISIEPNWVTIKNNLNVIATYLVPRFIRVNEPDVQRDSLIQTLQEQFPNWREEDV